MFSTKKFIRLSMAGLALSVSLFPVLIGQVALAEDPSGGVPSQGLLDDLTNSAQKTGVSSGLTQTGEYQDIRITVAKIIKNAMALLGTLAVVLIIYAGYLWMTAAGNEEQVSKAKKLIASAVIGLCIILASYSIATFVIDNIVKSTVNVPAAP